MWWCSSDPGSGDVRLLRKDGAAAAVSVLPDGWSVRNRAIGYGGRPYAVDGERLVFTAYADGRLYRLTDAGPAALTPADEGGRTTCYADLQLTEEHVWCVREVTRAAADAEDGDPAPRTRRDIVRVPLDGSAAGDGAAITSAVASHHFLTNVRVAPDGARLAWIGWDHPAMPWEGTELLVGDLDDGVVSNERVVLGAADVAVSQAEWDGTSGLWAMADPDGWWNLHHVGLDGMSRCVLPMERDCAGAIWRIGSTWFAVADGRIVLAHALGAQQLAVLDLATLSLREIATGWTWFGSDLAADANTVVAVAGSEDHAETVLRIDVRADTVDVLIEPDERTQPLARPQRRVARGADGVDVHYVWYPPTNPECAAPDGDLAPLLIHVHGGPTGRTRALPDVEFALFTSRGFGVASVDYGGSVGYGRAYRDRLEHTWGVVDVADCVTVAGALAASGEADPARTAIRGGSAGGWTSLACLASTDVFCAGGVYYPISDAFDWSGASTHDFESRYLRYLIGELPRDRARYERVSPLQHADAITVPIVMLQGADDPICPPVHAHSIVENLRARGVWHRLELFPGEGHGFRKASSVEASLRAELELYAHAMRLPVAPERSEERA